MTAALIAMMLRRARWFGLASASDVGGRGTGIRILVRISREGSSAPRRNTARRAAPFTVLAAAGSATRSAGVSRLRARYKKAQ
jgi:hypothetical protein